MADSFYDGATALRDEPISPIPADLVAAALAYLRRKGALDLAPILGLEVAE